MWACLSCPAALRAALAFRRLLPCPVLLKGLQQIGKMGEKRRRESFHMTGRLEGLCTALTLQRFAVQEQSAEGVLYAVQGNNGGVQAMTKPISLSRPVKNCSRGHTREQNMDAGTHVWSAGLGQRQFC